MPGTTRVREVAELTGFMQGRAEPETVRALLELVNRLRLGGRASAGDEALIRVLRARFGGELEMIERAGSR